MRVRSELKPLLLVVFVTVSFGVWNGWDIWVTSVAWTGLVVLCSEEVR